MTALKIRSIAAEFVARIAPPQDLVISKDSRYVSSHFHRCRLRPETLGCGKYVRCPRQLAAGLPCRRRHRLELLKPGLNLPRAFPAHRLHHY